MPSQALRTEAAVSMISINPNIPGIIIPSGDATTLIGMILAAAAAVWLLTTFGGFIRLFFTKGAFIPKQTVNIIQKMLHITGCMKGN